MDRNVEGGATYWYRLRAWDGADKVTYFGPLSATAVAMTGGFALGRVAPNPSDEATHIDFVVGRKAPVRLSVVDIQGREVAVLVDGEQSAGSHQATWSGEGRSGRVAPGLYFFRYDALGQSWTARVVRTR